jgi:hypothetical protein
MQYEQHRVRCGCGKIHTAVRPEGARPGPVGYGPNLQAFAVYLMVVQFLPAHRVVALCESLTGAAPSVGFVHGMLARTAGALAQVHDRIRTLITLAHAATTRSPRCATPCSTEPGCPSSPHPPEHPVTSNPHRRPTADRPSPMPHSQLNAYPEARVLGTTAFAEDHYSAGPALAQAAPQAGQEHLDLDVLKAPRESPIARSRR